MEWTQIIPAGISVVKKLFGGKRDDVPLGLAHPGVNQQRLRSDPVYAEAVRMAAAAHQRQYGVPWMRDNSPASAVQQSIAGFLKKVKPKITPNILPSADAKNTHAAATPFVQNPKSLMPEIPAWLGIVVLIAIVFVFYRR